MKKHKYMKEITLFLIAILTFSWAAPAWANSGPSQWTGVSSTGAIITDENCPIVVEAEELTFDIQEFPKDYYDTVEEYLAYGCKVTAKYNFYNPADYTVKATLVFPFGNAPDYYNVYDGEINYLRRNVDAEKYDITVNGAAIEKKLRHTLSYFYAEFNLKEDMARLHDGYMYDSFYSPDLPVTKYTYTSSSIDKIKYDAAYTSFFLSADSSKTKVLLEECNGVSLKDDGIQVGRWADNGGTFYLYVMGQPLDEMPLWTVYENAAEEKKIDGDIILTDIEGITFEEFALTDYDENSLVSKYDWYNAIVANLKENQWEHGLISTENSLDVADSLMRWYEYEITLEPGERIVNEVMAPLYPSINSNYDPNIYDYTYLLSPAKTWADFGSLEIEINTPYYITESGIEGFTQTEKGYRLLLDGLPQGELEFTLSSVENPKESNLYSSYMTKIIVSFLINIVGAFLIIGGLFKAFSWFLKRKNK